MAAFLRGLCPTASTEHFQIPPPRMPVHDFVVCLWPHPESQAEEMVSAPCSRRGPAPGVQGYGVAVGRCTAEVPPCPPSGKTGASAGPGLQESADFGPPQLHPLAGLHREQQFSVTKLKQP